MFKNAIKILSNLNNFLGVSLFGTRHFTTTAVPKNIEIHTLDNSSNEYSDRVYDFK